ncbi:MAG: PilZ domain-containing protein [Alphaproteobacteria bacterium]|nr:PilZ domain-containing protein [Alphaproteobacteria bacterium]
MGLLQRIKGLAGGEAGPAEAPRPVPGSERRRHRRLQTSKLTIVINGKRYKTKDWSLGGFRVVVPGNNFNTNQRISGAIHGPGLFDRGAYEAVIVWTADDGELGAHFIDLSHESFLAMSAAQV